MAIGLTLQLDSTAPLAGAASHSLRDELMSLDRIRRTPGHELSPAEWLSVGVAWLFAGLGVDPLQVTGEHVLLSVLYHGTPLAQSPSEISSLIDRLQLASSNLAHGTPLVGDFGKRTPAALKFAERHLWARSGKPAVRGKKGAEELPPYCDPAGSDYVEVRFHRIQDWLTDAARHPRLGPTIHRGGSILLESALSAVRGELLRRFGPGRLVIDGGGRLRIVISDPAAAVDLGSRVTDILGHLLIPNSGSSLADQIAPALAEIVGAEPDTQTFAQAARELALSSLPRWSIRLASIETAGAVTTSPLIQEEWDLFDRQTCISCGHFDDGDVDIKDQEERKWIGRLCRACRLRLRLGRWKPRDRQIDLAFRDQGRRRALRVADTSLAFTEILAIDVNRLGAVLTRRHAFDADFHDITCISRRSLRFTAHWLLAVGQTVEEFSDRGVELLVWAGDDLVVGTRMKSPSAELVRFARRLDANLDRLRDELPVCDRLDFSGGWVGPQTEPKDERRCHRDRLFHAYGRETAAKELSQSHPELSPTGLHPRSDKEKKKEWYVFSSSRHASVIVTHLAPPAISVKKQEDQELKWHGSIADSLAAAGLDSHEVTRYRCVRQHRPTGEMIRIFAVTAQEQAAPDEPRNCCCLQNQT